MYGLDQNMLNQNIVRNMLLHRYRLLLCLLWVPVCSYGQQLQERLIVSDAGDSIMLKAFRSAFDSSGNYYFETLLPGKGVKFALTTNKRKLGPVSWSPGMAVVPYKATIGDAFFSDTSFSKLCYKNKSGTSIYGPHPGKIREVLEFGRNNVVMELCTGPISHLYINDSLVSTIDSTKQHWSCNFSDNGNVIYSIFKRGMYRLYVNHKLLDSSDDEFANIAIDDKKSYVYTRQVDGKYYVHTAKRKFGPFGAVDYADFINGEAWYFTGCFDSICYVLVNDHLYNNIREAHILSTDEVSGRSSYRSSEQISVVPIDRDRYIFAYNEYNRDGTQMNVNGNVSLHNYTQIGNIFFDSAGHFAFFGSRRDSVGVDCTYKNINGKETRIKPFKKNPNFPHFLQLAPDGTSTYYVEAADSVYLFRSDTLARKPSVRKRFRIWDASVLPASHADARQYFAGINMDGNSYILYNNTSSKPMPLIFPAYNRLDDVIKGSIVAGDINANGFFIMVCTDKNKYTLNINNVIYRDVEGVDQIFGDQSYLTDRALFFYGRKGSAFYEFRLNF